MRVKNDGFYLNNIKIVDKKSELQFAIFDILIDHYFYEIKNGCCYLHIKSICDQLEKKSIFLDNPQNQINNAIYKIRNNIKKITHINYQIIENKRWEGFRINNEVFLCRGDNFL